MKHTPVKVWSYCRKNRLKCRLSLNTCLNRTWVLIVGFMNTIIFSVIFKRSLCKIVVSVACYSYSLSKSAIFLTLWNFYFLNLYTPIVYGILDTTKTFDVSGKCNIQLCQIHNFPLNKESFFGLDMVLIQGK